MISIIIPTLNEEKNLKDLIKKISHIMRHKNEKFEIIIVDKFSNDNTARTIEKLKKIYNIKFFQKNLDLSNAVLYGIKRAKGEIIGVMDADFSHPPEKIPEFIDKIKIKNFDIVIGKRIKVEKWEFHRKLISKLGEILARAIVNISDPMSGFFFFKKEKIKKNLYNFSPIGYKILLEILVKSDFEKIGEIEYVFKNRERGKSKLNLKEYLKFLYHISKLYAYKFKKIFKQKNKS